MSTKWNGSSVMAEFEKVAAESGLITTDLKPGKEDIVGNPSTPTPVKDHRRYEPTEEYDVTKGEGKDIIEKAHPKTVSVADAMGAGGVVENQIEQQEKNIDIATKMPSGALFGIHAELVKGLAKKANELEDQGKVKEAMRIDETIRRIADSPFDDGRLVKTAWFGAIVGLVSMVAPSLYNYMKGGTVTQTTAKGKTRTTSKGRMPMGRAGKAATLFGGAMLVLSAFGNKITSRKESLKEDVKDLYDILQKAKSKGSKSAESAASMIKPYMAKLAKPLDDKNFKTYVKHFNDLQSVIPKLQPLLARVKIELGTGKWYHFGFDITSRLERKYIDFVETVAETKDLLSKAQRYGKGMDALVERSKQEPYVDPKENVARLQKILGADVTGEMNMETVSLASKLEKNIDKALSYLGVSGNGTFQNKIVKGGEISIDLDKLERVLHLIDKAMKRKQK